MKCVPKSASSPRFYKKAGAGLKTLSALRATGRDGRDKQSRGAELRAFRTFLSALPCEEQQPGSEAASRAGSSAMFTVNVSSSMSYKGHPASISPSRQQPDRRRQRNQRYHTAVPLRRLR